MTPTDRQKNMFKLFIRKTLLIMGVSALALGTLHPVAAQDDPAVDIGSQAQPMPADTARPYVPSGFSSNDTALLEQALSAVKSRNFAGADSMAAGLSNPVARKIVTWTIINNDGNIYSFAALDAARRDLWGWPREAKRQIAAEKLIGMSGMTAQQIVDWFKGAPPQTTEGATALITAYGNLARSEDARALAKSWWRTKVFDSMAQANFYQAFGSYLTQDDHKARLLCLEVNFQNANSQAIRDMTAYVGQHDADVANAVIAMRTGSASSDSLYQAALVGDPHNPALAFARAKYLNGKGLETLGFQLLPDLPQASVSPDAASQLYTLRLGYFKAALKARNYRAAYDAMNNGGFEPGESMAEAEFFAGWMALVKLNDTDAAIRHFQLLATAGTSPITQGRANYWLGRAYEKRNQPGANGLAGDAEMAQTYYTKGGQYIYAFYGQMAAEKAGIKTITLGKDPVPTAADRARFEGRDMIKAARLLGQTGELDLFRTLVLHLDDVMPNAEEEALLVDLVGQYDSQLMAMKVARVSMQRGFYLPERAYPMRSVPNVQGPEPAFVLAITRQESSFDPSVRSSANARGMMQLIPSTGRAVANRLGIGYSGDAALYEPDYNMTLGKYHLGELVDKFDGSYIMAAAGYNAGPSRMQTWIDTCGDPRGATADPLSFIECHPFTETRNYMMRVTENMRIYRARLNGGTAPLTAMADVQRGFPGPIGPFTGPEFGDVASPDAPISYADYNKGVTTNAAAAAQLTGTPLAPASTTMAPVPNPPVSMKPVANPVVKAEPVRKKTMAKAAKKKKAEPVKKKKATKKKRD
jgi:soluble lytic murein transglycosylase